MRQPDISESAVAEAAETLRCLASEVDPGALLAAVAGHLLIVEAGTYSEGTHGDAILRLELLGYHLLPTFEGPARISPLAEHVAACDAAVEVLMAAPRDRESERAKCLIASDLRLEAEVVRGSAYPDHLAAAILEVQGARETWFARRCGIGPRRAVEIVGAIIRAHLAASREIGAEATAFAEVHCSQYRTKRLHKPRWARAIGAPGAAWAHAYSERLAQLAPSRFPVSLGDLVLDHPPELAEWDALVGMIGLTPAVRAKMVSPVDMRTRPLFVLPDQRVILADWTNALDNLWATFETEAGSDPQFYQEYQARRGRVSERQALDSIRRLFPGSCVYRGVAYPDFDGQAGATAELDILVVWQPFVVLAEVKAGQFRLEGRLGDVARLRSDLQRTVGKAASQLDRALRYMNSTDQPVFREIETGRMCCFRMSSIQRTYALAVTQQELGLGARVSEIRDLGLLREALLPVTMGAANLDTITRFCSGPEVFLHYLERRAAIQQRPHSVVADELNLFGAYLDDRLQSLETIMAAMDVEPVTFVLTALSERFDTESMHRLVGTPAGPAIGLKLPPGIEELLADLRSNQDMGPRRIAFELLDLPQSELLAVAATLHILRKQAPPEPMVLRRIVKEEGTLLVFTLGAVGLSPTQLKDALVERALADHQRRKSPRLIALGVDLGSPGKSVTAAIWCGEYRVSDSEFDRQIETAPVQSVPGWRPPGRNAPCWCGSGRKHKLCCLNRLNLPPR